MESIDYHEELRVVSRWDEFHDHFFTPLYNIRSPHDQRMRCLWDGQFPVWDQAQIDLKEYFFMELYVLCSRHISDQSIAVDLILDILPDCLRALEKAASYGDDRSVDIGVYMNTIYSGIRDYICGMVNKGSNSASSTRPEEQDPPNGRFRSWMQHPGFERCRDICEDADGNQVIHWNLTSYFNSRTQRVSISSAEELDLIQLQKWHSSRNGGLKILNTEKAETVADIIEHPEEQDRTKEIGDGHIQYQPQHRTRRSVKPTHKVFSGRITKWEPKSLLVHCNGDWAPRPSDKELLKKSLLEHSVIPPTAITVAEKQKFFIEKARNRRLELKDIYKLMRPVHQVKVPANIDELEHWSPESTFRGTMRQTLSKVTNGVNKFENIKLPTDIEQNVQQNGEEPEENDDDPIEGPKKRPWGWWAVAEDVEWNDDIKAVMHINGPSTREVVEPCKPEGVDKLKVKAKVMTEEEYAKLHAPKPPKNKKTKEAEKNEDDEKLEGSNEAKNDDSVEDTDGFGNGEAVFETNEQSSQHTSEPKTPDFPQIISINSNSGRGKFITLTKGDYFTK